MKKSFAAIAVVLAAGITITTAGCGSGGKNLAVLSSNWYTGTTFYGFQPDVCENKERIVYSVKHEQPEEAYANATYTVQYEDGTYTTEFYAATFDAKDFPESYLESYQKAGKFTAYCYKTWLEIPSVTFTLKSDPDHPVKFDKDTSFANNVYTESWFLSVNEYLRPLYSKQTVQSVTPWNLKPKKLENDDAYKIFDLEYESFYSFDGTSVTTVFTDKLATNSEKQTNEKLKLNKSKYSLFDPFAQDIVVRASDLYSGSNLSQPVSFYVPKSGKIENFTFTGYDNNVQFASEQQKNDVIDQLVKAGLYEEDKPAESNKPDDGAEDNTQDGNENDGAENQSENAEDEQPKVRPLKTVAVNITYTSGSQPGGTQTYWFTSVTDKRNNVGRATMLKTTVPLSYYHGTLVYTLDRIESSLNKI